MNKNWKTEDGLFNATTLQNRAQELVAGQERGDHMLDDTDDSNSKLGKAFVLAMPARNMSHPRLFRTYEARENASINCKIWEAVRATTAAVAFFKRIAIGPEEFIDAGIKCNNPAIRLLTEAQDVFGGNRTLNCLVSIGTGHPGVIGLSTPNVFQNILSTNVVEVLKQIATDCKGTAHELSQRFKKAPGSYFRFNVTHGAGTISLQEWEKMGEIRTHTKAYLEETVVSAFVNEVVSLLCKPGDTRVTLTDACEYNFYFSACHPSMVLGIMIPTVRKHGPNATGILTVPAVAMLQQQRRGLSLRCAAKDTRVEVQKWDD
ncbi:MAG: hypothetical protein M1826_001372 [Phylliscum demangeonii]|nr:MAG: hypothetical protein M1826_001372 [Phylliscum demangeonii]